MYSETWAPSSQQERQELVEGELTSGGFEENHFLLLFLPSHLLAASAPSFPSPADPIMRDHHKVWQLNVLSTLCSQSPSFL